MSWLAQMQMAVQRQPRPSPDPEYVLRGHRTGVQALLHHPKMDLLYSGSVVPALSAYANNSLPSYILSHQAKPPLRPSD